MKAKNLKHLHKIVGERENWRCEYCGKGFYHGYCFNENDINQYVCAHHVLRQGSRPDQKLNPDICRNICKTCHGLVHSGVIKEKPLKPNKE